MGLRTSGAVYSRHGDQHIEVLVEKTCGGPGGCLVEADGGNLDVRGCDFGTGESSNALRPGLKHAIVSEDNGVRGVEILNEIGDQAVIANNEPERKGP